MHLLLISGDDEDDNYGDYDDYDEDDNNDNDDETDDGCDDDDYAVDNDQGSSCEGTVTGPAWLCTPATHRGFSLLFQMFLHIFRRSKFFCSDISIIPDVSHISRSYQIKLH